MIRYKLAFWEFNAGAWSDAMRHVVSLVGDDIVSGVMEVDKSTVLAWMKMKSGYDKFPYPRMTNFLKFCNEFDYDPREFFILGE